MDALVDRLIEGLEALGRWGRRQTRRGFDACTHGLPWADRLVLRRDLALVGDDLAWLSVFLSVNGWMAWSYYRRFAPGAHQGTHGNLFQAGWWIVSDAAGRQDNLFPFLWWILAAAAVVIWSFALAYGALLGVVVLLRAMNAWRRRPEDVRDPWTLARRRWIDHRDRTLERWRTSDRARLVADEQAALRHAWAQGEEEAARAQRRRRASECPREGAVSEGADPAAEPARRRRL